MCRFWLRRRLFLGNRYRHQGLCPDIHIFPILAMCVEYSCRVRAYLCLSASWSTRGSDYFRSPLNLVTTHGRSPRINSKTSFTSALGVFGRVCCSYDASCEDARMERPDHRQEICLLDTYDRVEDVHSDADCFQRGIDLILHYPNNITTTIDLESRLLLRLGPQPENQRIMQP